MIYRKFQHGGMPESSDTGHYDEKDRRGNQYTPGVNNIHQAYEYILGKKFGKAFDIDKLYRYFAAVGSHEGKGNMTAVQNGGGPGRGLFQIEDNSNGQDYRDRYDKFLRIRRLKTPKWYSDWKGTNVSNLGKSEQLELLMAYNYFGSSNKNNLLGFLNNSISPGELAARNHKRVFTAKGAPKDTGYMSKDAVRQKYIDDINNIYNTQNDSLVNKVLFDNSYKTNFPNTPNNTTTLAREVPFGYRCGDKDCSLNDHNSGPITVEGVEKERKATALKYGKAEDILQGRDVVRLKSKDNIWDKYKKGGILYRSYQRGGNMGNKNYMKLVLEKMNEYPEFRDMPEEAKADVIKKMNYSNFDLSDEELPAFAKWMKDNNNNYWDFASYDPLVAYKYALKKSANGHTGDLGKKPSHPTFSDESLYHKQNYDAHERGGGGHWDMSPEGKPYFLPSGTNMYFAHGYRDPVTGVAGLRGRMDSQGDYTAKIVKLPDSNRRWDPVAAKEENEFVRAMTGMDFDNPKNTVKLKDHYDMYRDESGHESGRLTKEGVKENQRMEELNTNLFKQRTRYGFMKKGGVFYKKSHGFDI
jgi:hypothetical protein